MRATKIPLQGMFVKNHAQGRAIWGGGSQGQSNEVINISICKSLTQEVFTPNMNIQCPPNPQK